MIWQEDPEGKIIYITHIKEVEKKKNMSLNLQDHLTHTGNTTFCDQEVEK